MTINLSKTIAKAVNILDSMSFQGFAKEYKDVCKDRAKQAVMNITLKKRLKPVNDDDKVVLGDYYYCNQSMVECRHQNITVRQWRQVCGFADCYQF